MPVECWPALSPGRLIGQSRAQRSTACAFRGSGARPCSATGYSARASAAAPGRRAVSKASNALARSRMAWREAGAMAGCGWLCTTQHASHPFFELHRRACEVSECMLSVVVVAVVVVVVDCACTTRVGQPVENLQPRLPGRRCRIQRAMLQQSLRRRALLRIEPQRPPAATLCAAAGQPFITSAARVEPSNASSRPVSSGRRLSSNARRSSASKA